MTHAEIRDLIVVFVALVIYQVVAAPLVMVAFREFLQRRRIAAAAKRDSDYGYTPEDKDGQA